ncbi:TRAP transporter substrate-binding protein [Chloroflexota bacterium]
MRKLTIILMPLLIVALLLGAIACDGEETTPTQAPTAMPTPEPITLKLCYAFGPQTSTGKHVTRFAEMVEEYTNGLVNVDVYPSAVLFPVAAEFEAVVKGSVDIAWISPYYMVGTDPANMLWYTEGLFESTEHGLAVLQDGRVMDILSARLEEAGVMPFGFVPFGMYSGYVTNVRPIRDFGTDLQGLKYGIRSGYPPTVLDEYAGYELVPLAREELLVSYMQGVIDVMCAGSLTQIVPDGWCGVADYVWIVPTGYMGGIPVMNLDAWNNLSDDMQDIIANEVIPDLVLESHAMIKGEEDTAREELLACMTDVYFATPEDVAAICEGVEDLPARIKRMEDIGPDILAIIEELRPSMN